MNNIYETESVETVIVGGGQAGLAIGYQLAKQGSSFLILDAHERIGDAWRTRWDSLRLFTPAGFDALPGMRFPAPRSYYPTKDEMADYLTSYAAKFSLPVRNNVRVDALASDGPRFRLAAGDLRFVADNVVLATSPELVPFVPPLANEIDPRICQLHSIDYSHPAQLRPGMVLVVGAGNSGADIAMDLAQQFDVKLSGRDVGHIPLPINRFTGAVIYPLIRFAFHRVLTVHNPVARKISRKLEEGHGLPLVRVKPKHLAAAGVERVPRMAKVKNGLPVLEDGRVMDVANVVWCTGYRPDYSWIDLPGFGNSKAAHHRGIVDEIPGLYFIGLNFQYSASSSQINGLGRDSAFVAKAITAKPTRVENRLFVS